MAGTYEQAAIGEPVSTGDPKILTQLKGMNEALDTSNKLEAKSLSLGNLGRWYTPVEIATEQERESASFGKLTTPDEVTGVVVPKNGIMAIAYRAIIKNTIGAAGKAAIFLGANQLKIAGSTVPVVQETSIAGGTGFVTIMSSQIGLAQGVEGGTSFATTGQILGQTGGLGGLCYVFVEAGTYAVSVQFKSSSGKVAAKERFLQVGVIGV